MNEPSETVRVPKGILKNSGRSVTNYEASVAEPLGMEYRHSSYSNQPVYGVPTAIPNKDNHGYSHPHMYLGSYGSLSSQPVMPVRMNPNYHGNPEAPHWAMSYEPPAVPDRVLSEELRFRQKLDTFISRKGNLIFKKLEDEDKPLLESRLEERKSEGNYGVTPSLDYYLPLDDTERFKEFFKMVQVGDIVVAEVLSKTVGGLVFRLLCCDGGKRAFLEDLNIKGHCHPSQTIPFDDPNDPTRTYEEDDKVRLEILEVNYESRRLMLGMKGIKISNEIRHAFPLGPILTSDDLPRQYLLTKIETKSRRRRSFEYLLESSAGFHNPNSIVCLGTSLGVFNVKHSLLLGLSGKFKPKDMANELRSAQNTKWAQQNVTIGIRHFKQGNQVEAFQCLNKAIIIDPHNVEGLVARGALYANNGNFEKATEDFEAALKSNPDHFNGRKYLAETLVVSGKRQQENNKPEEAILAYSKCLSILPEHKDSILTLMSLHEEMEKFDMPRLAGLTGSKALDLKEKLRLQITQEIAKKKLGYYEKMNTNLSQGKKKDENSSDSDSSSSDSSESDSGSSSDDDLSRRDKKRKKKRRKSKKSKKIKPARELSLSPFSRRLAGQDPGPTALNVYGGSSNYPAWGQQVGINRIADNSDEESQHSSRKSKEKKKSKKKKEKHRKKKRNNSSSSDSDSDSREKRKSKKRRSKVITDFGDIEEKLTAFFSKCEQDQTEARVPPQSVKVTLEQTVDKSNYLNPYDSSSRRIELIREEAHRDRMPQDYRSTTSASSSLPVHSHSIDYDSYIKPEAIVRTVQNDQSDASKKFEMRFNVKAPAPPIISKIGSELPQNATVDEVSQTSKWRTIGTVSSEQQQKANIETSKSSDATKVTNTVATALHKRTPGAVDKVYPKPTREIERHYRSKQRSHSRSRSYSRSRSRSTSPRRRRRSPTPEHHLSDSRSRRRSRSRERRRSHSRSRSHSGGRRRHMASPGRGPIRFFRGYHPAIRRGSSRYHSSSQSFVPRGGMGGNYSKFRNRFNRSTSKSRSRSRSGSPQRADISKERSKNGSPKPQTDARSSVANRSKDEGRTDLAHGTYKSANIDHVSKESLIHENTEIRVMGLTTRKLADVEELLDKRKAHRKEEMKEMNPDFFRNP